MAAYTACRFRYEFGIAVRDRGRRRGRAVHHHEPEGDQCERDQDEDLDVELRALHAQPLHDPAKRVPALLEVPELVVAGAGRREEDDLSRPRERACVRDRPLERAVDVAVDQRHHARALVADEVDGLDVRADRLCEGAEVLALRRASEDQVHALPREGLERANRGGHVRRLRVVRRTARRAARARSRGGAGRRGRYGAPARSHRRRARRRAPPQWPRRRSRGCAGPGGRGSAGSGSSAPNSIPSSPDPRGTILVPARSKMRSLAAR